MDQIHRMDIFTARLPACSGCFRLASFFPNEWSSCAEKGLVASRDAVVGRDHTVVRRFVAGCRHFSHTMPPRKHALVKGLVSREPENREYRADCGDLPLTGEPGKDFSVRRGGFATLALKVLCLLTSDGSERQPDWPWKAKQPHHTASK
jgi:hypothetical protein